MNRENLRKLSDYLLSGQLEAGFDMCRYSDDVNHALELVCGSVGCAVGHGPYAGIPKKRGENWMGYAYRSFCVTNREYAWCFSGLWAKVDNTPRGAGLRIKWLLDHGLPDNWESQIYGLEPLCYL